MPNVKQVLNAVVSQVQQMKAVVNQQVFFASRPFVTANNWMNSFAVFGPDFA
ncbi:hypothetical protein DFQ01_11290 [Paenibacillus cellulosilyticus]|uniref:Uncharacterized protein n=1 Tax=Paenibacillus cellulosilyticus TaxID=375489 RepID=A0A2V2YRQ9_9BACL|nr:hypothetical protein [Paenibacillus cellulosilyticus]PWW00737.1 hypothetical protein DFQ01_11290 [Paenibacillus cellulosilyticus]QKS45593.1 hypothetical protein HUB94_15010 [Paenibacillus cellulosilyticus]